ncbi:hypothetical protein BBP40_004305 [Aspergillus hancockii]|nr:hypothetical protein BBP40_004305 [Aspergillus hancockii]
MSSDAGSNCEALSHESVIQNRSRAQKLLGHLNCKAARVQQLAAELKRGLASVAKLSDAAGA